MHHILPPLGMALIGLACIAVMVTGCQQATSADKEAGWTLTFSDEFDGDAVDTEKWEVLTRKDSHNDEKQYYLPEMASVVDGVLRITSTDEPFDGKAYRSARLESWFTQKYGRFEARAKVPTSKGIWPAFWLLPRTGNWPHDGEIDIMEHHGSNPTMVNAAIHFANENGRHDHVYREYRAKDDDGNSVSFPDGFHVYAVKWSPHEIMFYVDGNEYYRVDREQVPISDVPMAVVINTAVGGIFDGDPDETTVFPQTFDIDYVRVYQYDGDYPPIPKPATKPALVNGDFRQGGLGWRLYSNAAVHSHNLEEKHQSIAYDGEGDGALKLYGRFGGSHITEATQEHILAEPGKTYTVRAKARMNADDSLAETQNRLEMILRFMDADGEPIEYAEVRKIIVDADTPTDAWHEHELSLTAPADAETLAVRFVFYQHERESGAAWIDQVSLEASE